MYRLMRELQERKKLQHLMTKSGVPAIWALLGLQSELGQDIGDSPKQGRTRVVDLLFKYRGVRQALRQVLGDQTRQRLGARQ